MKFDQTRIENVCQTVVTTQNTHHKISRPSTMAETIIKLKFRVE